MQGKHVTAVDTWKPLAKKSMASQCTEHNVEKYSTFSWLQCCHWQYGFIFIRLAVVSSQICKIPRNSQKIQTYSSSRSSKFIDLGVNQKRICNFLLVINSNYVCISYHFRDIDACCLKIAYFVHPTLAWHALAEERPAISSWYYYQRSLYTTEK